MAARPPTAVLAGAVTLVIYTFLQGLKGTPICKKGKQRCTKRISWKDEVTAEPSPRGPQPMAPPAHVLPERNSHLLPVDLYVPSPKRWRRLCSYSVSHAFFPHSMQQIKHTGLSYLTQKVHLLILLGTLDFRGLSFVFLFVILRYQKNYFPLKCTNRKTNSANIVVISNAFSVQKTGAVGAVDSAQLTRALAKLSTCTSHTAASEVTIFSRKQLLHDIFIPCYRI